METRTFNDGAGDGNLTTATNWSGSTTPIAGDSVVFADYSREITTGLGSVALASVIVGPGNTSKFTAPITTGEITSLDFSGSGPYAKFAGNVVTGVINIARARKIQVDSGTWGSSGEIRVSDGTIEFAAAVVMHNLYNGAGHLTLYANGTEIPLLRNSSGYIICDGRSVEDYIGGSGSALVLRNAALISDGSTTATAFIAHGAHLILENSSGTNDEVVCAGTIDVSRTKGTQTFTDRYMLPGGRFIDSKAFVSTITTDHPFTGASSSAGGWSPLP